MPFFRWLFRNVLNSVPFGIATMVAVAVYIAVGSGWVGLRERLEMDELLFFNWWPLKILMVLLVANLAVVTVVRIPLTVPRYGVWTIHMGIILLVMSLSAYYTGKQEGIVPLDRGRDVSHYYDRWHRALYVRTPFGDGPFMALDGLPRYKEYDELLGNNGRLASFTGLEPRTRTIDVQTDRRSVVPLHQALGLSNPIRLDVIGYYPFARGERWRIDPAGGTVGLKVRPAGGDPDDSAWLVASDPSARLVPIGGTAAIEHRHLPTQADVDISTDAARRVHKLTIRVGDQSRELLVEPGQVVPVESTPYSVEVEGFEPQFPLSDGSGRADTLLVKITRKGISGRADLTFRRTILSDRDVQTDFDLAAPDAGPFGKRLREGLLDDGIQLAYTFNDPTRLLSTMQQITTKYVLFTCDDAPGITLLRVSSRRPAVVNRADAHAELAITASPGVFAGGGPDRDVMRLDVERVDHVVASDRVIAIPEAQRNVQESLAGIGQMLRVRVRCGEWSTVVPVPFHPFPMDSSRWDFAGRVSIPGASGDFQLVLGRKMLPLPRTVRLERFEAIPYAGGEGPMGGGVMRDFRSTITLIDEETGRSEELTASLNSPAFFRIGGRIPLLMPSQSWLLSQASWDPQNPDWTALQVGNRPAVTMMMVACGMIFVGLMYAFYAKPIILRRMKDRALRHARAKKNVAPAMGHPEGA